MSNDQTNIQLQDGAFKRFVMKNKDTREMLFYAVGLTTAQFILFKLLYPFPDFFSDSYSYIYAASTHLKISIWPIGYSWFLAAFHYISHSDTALITFQYFFLEVSAAYFFLSVLYLHNLGKTPKIILFVFLFCNPLFLYLSNYVNSDPFFAALSLLWFTQMIWMIRQPKNHHLLTLSALTLACFTVRNNAYYYPLIVTIALILSPQSAYKKSLGLSFVLASILTFIGFERNAAHKITGTSQFSLFTGWQLANNALYIYDKIKVDSTKLPSSASRDLDRMSREFVRSIPDTFDYRQYLQYYVGNYFIRQPNAPLKQYLWSHYDVAGDSSQVQAWGKASVVFDEYGRWIIMHNPAAYVRYFIIPNVRNYFLPPLEKLEIYNLGVNDVPIVVQDWFDYKTPDVWAASKRIQANLLFIFPPLFLLINVIFLVTTAWLLVGLKVKSHIRFRNSAIYINIGFMLMNFGFSVFATINVFRYQFIPMILCLTYSLVVIEILDKRKSNDIQPLSSIGKKYEVEVEIAK